jgi:hypothetical protein
MMQRVVDYVDDHGGYTRCSVLKEVFTRGMKLASMGKSPDIDTKSYIATYLTKADIQCS